MGYMVEKGKPNKPLENASHLGFDEIERLMLGAAVDEGPGTKENKPGSYESFLSFAQQQAKNKG